MDIEQNSQAVHTTTRTVIGDFNDAFNRQDPEALAALLTEDTVFEGTSPQPDGTRLEGKAAVVAFWREWFKKNPDARFEAEETIICGNRAVVRWISIVRFGMGNRSTYAGSIFSQYATASGREARIRKRVSGRATMIPDPISFRFARPTRT